MGLAVLVLGSGVLGVWGLGVGRGREWRETGKVGKSSPTACVILSLCFLGMLFLKCSNGAQLPVRVGEKTFLGRIHAQPTSSAVCISRFITRFHQPYN